MSPSNFPYRAGPFFIIILSLFWHQITFAQGRISGIVKDTENQPLPSVTIIVNHSKVATTSNADGTFSIDAVPGDWLIFSSVGMHKKMLQVKKIEQLFITMSYDRRNLEEVVTVGYGSLKKKDITGAVTKLALPEFNTGIITDPLQQMQGKVAGLVLIKPGGDPNGEFTVRIRGAASIEGQPPLLVIDGVAIDNFYKSVSTLNPGDIESYDILKDASATAIYGSRGANGVILVNTKKAIAGTIAVNYQGFFGVEKVAHSLELLQADEWRKATAQMNPGSLDQNANTDWQNAITQTAISQSHLASITTGNEHINLRASVGYINQQGVILGTGKEAATARITAIQKNLNNRLEIRYSLNASTTKRNLLPDQNSPNQSRTSSGSDIFYLAKTFLPVWPIYNQDGSYFFPPSSVPNPLFILNDLHSKRKENFFQGSLKADYEIVKNLKLGILTSLSRANDAYDKYYPPFPGTQGLAEASKAAFNSQSFSGDIHGNYHHDWGKHHIDVTGVYEYNKFVNDGFGVTARGFQVNDFLTNNLAAATQVQTSDLFSYKNEVRLISFLARAVYNFDNRYILTATFRRDGSSKFGPNHRWGNFPSLAVAWSLKNEAFMKPVEWLDDLKLRVSVGTTGNQENLPPYSYQWLYGPTGPYLSSNGQFYQGYSATQQENPNLRWEVRKSFNIGLDYALLQNRLSGTVDVFYDRTEGMLFNYGIPQPPFLRDQVYANAASAVNKGVEITINGSITQNKNFSWDVHGNFTTVRNYITELLGQFGGFNLSLNDRSYGYAIGGATGRSAVTKLSVGYPAGVFWLPQHAGLDATGNELFNNYDADGKLVGKSISFTDQDKIYINPTAQFTWGFTNNISWKKFDMSFFLRGIQGQKIFANSLMIQEASSYLPGRNVTQKALSNGFANLPFASTYWLRNASFCRLENIQIGYTIKNLKAIRLLRLYLTVNNLFVITSYDAVDPEGISESTQRYIDLSYYPKTRGYSFGVNMEF